MRILLCVVRSLVIAVLLVLPSAGWTSAAEPTLRVMEPAQGVRISGDQVRVAVQTGGITLVPSTVPLTEAGRRPDANRPGEGHLHFMLDLAPVVVWDKAEPYTFADVPAGGHRLTVELVNNDHSPLVPPVVQVIDFQVTPMMPRSGAGGAASSPVAGLGLLMLAIVALTVVWVEQHHVCGPGRGQRGSSN